MEFTEGKRKREDDNQWRRGKDGERDDERNRVIDRRKKEERKR